MRTAVGCGIFLWMFSLFVMKGDAVYLTLGIIAIGSAIYLDHIKK